MFHPSYYAPFNCKLLRYHLHGVSVLKISLIRIIIKQVKLIANLRLIICATAAFQTHHNGSVCIIPGTPIFFFYFFEDCLSFIHRSGTPQISSYPLNKFQFQFHSSLNPDYSSKYSSFLKPHDISSLAFPSKTRYYSKSYSLF